MVQIHQFVDIQNANESQNTIDPICRNWSKVKFSSTITYIQCHVQFIEKYHSKHGEAIEYAINISSTAEKMLPNKNNESKQRGFTMKASYGKMLDPIKFFQKQGKFQHGNNRCFR